MDATLTLDAVPLAGQAADRGSQGRYGHEQHTCEKHKCSNDPKCDQVPPCQARTLHSNCNILVTATSPPDSVSESDTCGGFLTTRALKRGGTPPAHSVGYLYTASSPGGLGRFGSQRGAKMPRPAQSVVPLLPSKQGP